MEGEVLGQEVVRRLADILRQRSVLGAEDANDEDDDEPSRRGE